MDVNNNKKWNNSIINISRVDGGPDPMNIEYDTRSLDGGARYIAKALEPVAKPQIADPRKLKTRREGRMTDSPRAPRKCIFNSTTEFFSVRDPAAKFVHAVCSKRKCRLLAEEG